MQNEIKTTHALDFSTRPWSRNPEWTDFQVGTCAGLYRATPEAFEILSIVNSEPGNGHFEDVLEWFEHSCRRDKKVLRFLEMMNEGFERHLIQKRGFKPNLNVNCLEKSYA